MKNVCYDFENDRRYFKCIYSEDTYEVVKYLKHRLPVLRVSAICQNDSAFYQACGLEEDINPFKDVNENCGYICKRINGLGYELIKNLQKKVCAGHDFICDYVNIEELKLNCLLENKMCDGINTVNLQKLFYNSSDDEVYCNGYTYGIFCDADMYNNRIGSTKITCDNSSYSGYCVDGIDKLVCSRENITNFCQNFENNEIVPIFNFSRCGQIGHLNWWDNIDGFNPSPLCVGYKEQTNCTDPLRAGLLCKIDGYMSTVARQIICNSNLGDRTPLCDDKIDVKCVDVSRSCTIHKHQLCDGVSDCIDGTDESNCKDITNKTCQRAYMTSGKVGGVGIPLAWIKDGAFDCINSDDELGQWPACGIGDTKRYSKADINSTCSEVYLCHPGHVEFPHLCDGKDSCGNENDVCRKSRKLPKIFESPVFVGEVARMLHCLNGLETLDSLINGSCSKVNFSLSDNSVLGRTKFRQLFLPQSLNWTANCDHIYGAAYVYLSCLNRCSHSSCILEHTIKFDSCKGKYKDRVFSLANNTYLTFLIRNKKDDSYHNDDIFPCRNGGCVSYEKVCNLVDDCGDASDELNCTNSFQCSETRTFLPLTKVCDKTIDCLDMSDECNTLCTKSMIESSVVYISGWILGILAIISNVLTIPVTIKSIRLSKTYENFSNNVFLCLISFGDLLYGIYIFAISVFNVYYGSSYCKRQLEWLTSATCSMVGVLNSVGIFISVLSMSVLSILRALNISQKSCISLPLTNKGQLKVYLIGAMIIIAAVSISILPLINSLENNFVNGLYHGPDNTLFLGAPNKGGHEDILKAYYGRLGTNSFSWRLIRKLTIEMFSNDYIGITNSNLKFYGNDGVCVFKYLVRKHDPQFIFVWSSHTIHILCFLTISVSYIIIAQVSSQHLPKLACKQANKSIEKRSRKVQRKVAIIILTDFVSWIPFVFVCVLHSADVLDGTAWYSIFSLVLNPMNTVINPLILNSMIIDTLMDTFGFFRSRFSLLTKLAINLQVLFERHTKVSPNDYGGDVNVEQYIQELNIIEATQSTNMWIRSTVED